MSDLSADSVASTRAPGGNSIAAAFSLGAISTLVGFISSVARAKVIAVTIGAVGLGVIAEATQLASLLALPAGALSGPVLAGACSRARAEHDDIALRRVTSTAVFCSLALTTIVVPLGPMVMYALVDTRHWPVSGMEAIVSAAATIALGTVTSLMALALGSSGAARVATILNLCGAVVGAILPIVATVAWGIRGAIWSGPAASLVMAGLAWRFGAIAGLRLDPRLAFPLDRAFLRSSFALSVATLAGSYAQQLYIGGIRLGLEHHGGTFGAEYNGQFQAALAIDAQVFSLLTSGLFAYHWPRFAHANRAQQQQLVTDVLKFTFGYFPLILLCASMCRTQLITLLYAHRFATAASILGWLLPCMLLRVLLFTCGAPLLFANRPVTLGLSSVAGHVILAACTFPAARWGGPAWIGPAMIVGYVLFLATTSSMTAWATGVRVPAKWFAVTIGAMVAILAADYALGGHTVARLLVAAASIGLVAYRQRLRLRRLLLRLLRRPASSA